MATAGSPEGTSTRPYLLRALHEWCTDNGFTPYLAVHVDSTVRVPMEYVKNNEIVLNIGFEATSGLKLGNDFVEFKARFGGAPREIVVPVDHVVAIYARENGQGMAFPVPTSSTAGGKPDGVGVSRSVGTMAGASALGGAAPRGLRLARSESEPPPTEAPPTGAPRPKDAGEEPPPPEPAGPGNGRPSLKRVK